MFEALGILEWIASKSLLTWHIRIVTGIVLRCTNHKEWWPEQFSSLFVVLYKETRHP